MAIPSIPRIPHSIFADSWFQYLRHVNTLHVNLTLIKQGLSLSGKWIGRFVSKQKPIDSLENFCTPGRSCGNQGQSFGVDSQFPDAPNSRIDPSCCHLKPA